MLLQIIEPQSQADWDAYYNLRFEILRKPWSQPKGSEKNDNEDDCIHALAIDNSNNYLGCGRAEWIDSSTIQIRYMAVVVNAQGLGIGAKILTYLEAKLKQEGAEIAVLHAREAAISFYTKQGYVLKEKSHLLFGEIQHYLMEKRIK
jgi:ribosomal protein S18 acetylase RimI-like enzyme